MKTDVIIPVYNNLRYTKRCIKSLKKSAEDFELIIIDNGSSYPTKKYLRRLDSRVLTNNSNLGYVKAINQGISISSSPYKLLLNNDVVLTPRFLEGMINKIKEGFDLVGPLSNKIDEKRSNNLQLISFKPRKTTLKSIRNFASRLHELNQGKFEEVDFLYGHCMLITEKAIKSVGLLDERYGFGNYDDLDFCKRARKKGFRICISKDSFVYHYCHKTFQKLCFDVEEIIRKNKEIYEKKWQK